MALHSSVVKPQTSATGKASSSGLTTIHGQFVSFLGPTSQTQVIFLSGYGTMLEQKIIGSQPQNSISTFYHRPTTEARQGRRAVMLQALERAQALKAQLRAKYGEFDIDKDLQELREERLTQLE